MTQTPSVTAPNETHSALRARVRRLHHRLRWLALGDRVLLAFALLVLMPWALVGADGLWPFSPGVRTVLRGMLLVAALGLWVWTFWPRRVRAHAAERGAALFDQYLGLTNQPLATAITLPQAPLDSDPLTRALHERAHAHADTLVHPDAPAKSAPLARLFRPLGWLWLALVVWGVTAVVFPSLPGIGVARLFLPAADVPPFSLTQMDVAWVPEAPNVGDDVRLSAMAEGLRPDAVTLVLLDPSHRPIERRPMTRVDATRFEITLRGLRQPVTFHLEAHGRRTKRYAIVPMPLEPTDESPAAGDGSSPQADPGGEQASDPNGESTAPDGGGEPGDGDTSPSQSSALLGELAELISDLSDLAAEAHDASAGEGPTPEQLAEQLASLAEGAAELAEQLDEAASASPEAAEALGALAEALRGLRSPGLLPGAPQAGEQPGWGDALAEAAQADAAELARGLGASQRELASGLANRGGGEESPDFRDPAAAGRYDETLGEGKVGVLSDALMQQVPPRYRDQTAAYFRRLAETEQPAPEESP